MTTASDMTERHAAALAEITELGLALARDLQARALAATDDKTAADLSLAFHRTARTVRQSLALEARLERERREAERQVSLQADQDRKARGEARRDGVLRAMVRLVWREAESARAAKWTEEELEDFLDHLETEPDFADAPIEVLLQRLRDHLGLPRPPPEPPIQNSA